MNVRQSIEAVWKPDISRKGRKEERKAKSGFLVFSASSAPLREAKRFLERCLIYRAKNAKAAKKGEKQNPVLGFLCEPCVSARDKFVFLGELYESQKGIRYFSY